MNGYIEEMMEQNIISATISMVTTVSCQLSMHMLKNTETMVMALDTSCGMLWLSIWRRAVSYTHLSLHRASVSCRVAILSFR